VLSSVAKLAENRPPPLRRARNLAIVACGPIG
jgi:hypothetical protein